MPEKKDKAKAKPAKPAYREVPSTDMLRCQLTEEEIIKYGDMLANANNSISQLNNELTEIKGNYKAKIQASEAEIGRLALAIAAKSEMRQVDIMTIFDSKLGTVAITRLDTAEVTSERKMSATESQMKMEV